jgi:hypothetical protein
MVKFFLFAPPPPNTAHPSTQAYILRPPPLTLTSPSVVFSSLPLITRAMSGSDSLTRLADMIGVLMERDALMISLIRGTPRVMYEKTSRKYSSTADYTRRNLTSCSKFPLLVPSCQQVWNKLLTTCNNLVDIIRLVARFFKEVLI